MISAAPAHTETLVVTDVGLDDACLDHHLAHRNIQLRNDPPQFVQSLLGLIGDDAVGAVVDGDRAAPAFLAFLATIAGHRLEQLGDVRGLGVVHLDQFPAQWRQLGDLLLRFQLLALTGGDLVGRGHQQYVAELALVQALGLQYQVQRLVPRHVLQAQGDIALHGIRGHQIQVGEVGDQLQYRTHVDVLEVQRQFLAGIGEIVLLAPLGIFRGHRLDADGQAIVGLVDQIVVEPARLDGDAGTVGLRAGVDELHRRGEVLDVQANPQRIRQLGLGEVQADLAALLLDIRAQGRVGQVDDHVALALFATLEIDVANGTTRRHVRLGLDRLGIAGRSRASLDRSGGSDAGAGRRIADHHEEVVAFHPGGVGRQRGQVDDQPCAILRLDHRDAARIAHAQLPVLGAELVLYPRQIEGDSRRLLDGIATRRGDGLVELQL
ncbi:Uncharacterised protein [Klebsiella pneumoniae]|nr:Uncharacterised protein [Klebsiella pneumoniae]